MTSRQRILNCIKRLPTDRIPISSYEITGYNHATWYHKEKSYQNLLAHIREKCDGICMWNPDYTYGDGIYSYNTYRSGNASYTEIKMNLNGEIFTSKYNIQDNVMTAWTTEHFLKDKNDIVRFMACELPMPDISMENLFQKQAEFGENGIMLISLDDPMCEAASLLGMELFMVTAMEEPELMEKLIIKLYERVLKSLKKILSHDVTDIMFRICGAEYCTPPYLPPSMFPVLETPFLTEMCGMINRAGGISRVHSHGKVRHILGEIVKTGAICVDPLEPIPDGDISLEEVKAKYGGELVLMGNIELKELEVSPPDRIKQIVRETVLTGKPGGGFILLPTATPINIPLSPKCEENFIVMLDTAMEYGKY